VSLLDRSLSVAPMMERTDRHFRYLLRLLAPRTLLYTEMVTAAAVVRGDADRLLRFDAIEHPLALQLGGSEPAQLAAAARAGAERGYDEINLNVGCPSARVQSGSFGVCLMHEPKLVAECVAAMRAAVAVPVTVKTRIGVDERDDYEFLAGFVGEIAAAGCRSVVVHARKAWLHGLSPKENRSVPPLSYERVAQIKRAFPTLEIIVNGGITSAEQVREQLALVDGVMIGREAYRNPYLMAHLDRMVYGATVALRTRIEVVEDYLEYAARELSAGTAPAALIRHLHGLFHGEPGAAAWRRTLTACTTARADPLAAIAHALAALDAPQGLVLTAGGRRPKSALTAAAT
jgi:tRNA-dihydrouridine synthase A